MDGKNTIIVLAGGASAQNHDIKTLHESGTVIGVNDAALHAKVHLCLTMDRTWFESRYEKIKALDIPFFARKEALINISERWSNLYIYENDRHSNAMTRENDHLNGVSSGHCAINLAYQMLGRGKCGQIIVLGMDCAPTGYWYGKDKDRPYEWQNQPEPRGITSDWAYSKWQEGKQDIVQQMKKEGVDLIWI